MNFAIIGTNFISDNFAEAAERVDGANIAAVYSRKKETANSFAERHGIKKCYTSYEEMLSDADIDAVYIASPTFMHKDHAILAMKAGKAVLCEKMICATEEEFFELKAAKEAYNATVIEAMRCDFDPLLLKVKELLPQIGKIKNAFFEYRQYSRRYDKFLQGEILNAFDPSIKNSALADIGIYPLHFCISLFGAPKNISSKSEFLHNGFEGSGDIYLDYGDMAARIVYSKIFEGENISKIEGEHGFITFDKINEPKLLTLTLKSGKTETFVPPQDSLNMACEIADFIKIAESDKEYGDRLFGTLSDVMKCVGEVYRQNNIFT